MDTTNALLLKQKSTRYIYYFYIALIVFLFNLISVLGVKSLLHDDPAWYKMVLHGNFPIWMSKFLYLSPFTEWIGWNIMAYSPNLARGLYVLLLMVPISCCFYYLFEQKFGFSRMTAFTAAIIPNILPLQWQIPAGINMSYVLWGLLPSVLSLILGLSYLEKNTPYNWIRLIGALLLYGIATQITEQALFIFPPFILAFWWYKKFEKKNIYLMSFFALTSILGYIHVILTPRVMIKINLLKEILNRILSFFKMSLPFGEINPVFAIVIFLGIVLIGLILLIKQPDKEVKFNRIFLYIFFFCWSICTIYIFIFMSKRFLPRYTYFSSFGVSALLFLSIEKILKIPVLRKFKLQIPVLATIILFSGVSRYIVLKEKFTPINTTFSIIQQELNKMDFPENSQIVIMGINPVNGGWERSSGYLQFALKRPDITGLMGHVNNSGYYNFQNHFESQKRGWDKEAYTNGLSLEYPLFLFFLDKNKRKLNQMDYLLQWWGENENAPWSIFRVDKISGEILPYRSGNGMTNYLSTLEKLKLAGINQSDILWGGPPTNRERKRLKEKLLPNI